MNGVRARNTTNEVTRDVRQSQAGATSIIQKTELRTIKPVW